LAITGLKAKLGEGGMGVVYRAFDTHLDRSVAIKILRADAITSPERKHRFLQEAKAASALNHPNIIIFTTPALLTARTSLPWRSSLARRSTS
jgi:serine/threonine protein kinase